MAKQENITLKIDVSYKEAIAAMEKYELQVKNLKAVNADLKKDNADLRNQYKEGAISLENYRKAIENNNRTIETNKQGIKQNKDAVKLLTDELKVNVSAQTAHETSIKSLRSTLDNTRKAYENLTQAEREGAKGKEMLNKIDSLNGKLNKAEGEYKKVIAATGDFKKLNNDVIDVLKAIDPQFGSIIEKLNNSETATKLFGKANEFLTQTLGLSAKAATAAQFAIMGLVGLGIMVAIEAYQKWNEKQEAVNKVYKESLASIQQQISTVKILEKVLFDSNRTYSERKNALDQLKKIMPEYNAMLTKEGQLIKDNTGATKKYTDSLLNAELAKRSVAKLADAKTELNDFEQTKNYKKYKEALFYQSSEKGDPNGFAKVMWDYGGVIREHTELEEEVKKWEKETEKYISNNLRTIQEHTQE